MNTKVTNTALRERTPADYAIEHGGYLANAAQSMLDAQNAHAELLVRLDDGEDVESEDLDAAQQVLSEAADRLRSTIYGFESRRDRAAAAAKEQKAAPVGCDHQWRTTGAGGTPRRALVCAKCKQHRDHMQPSAVDAVTELLASWRAEDSSMSAVAAIRTTRCDELEAAIAATGTQQVGEFWRLVHSGGLQFGELYDSEWHASAAQLRFNGDSTGEPFTVQRLELIAARQPGASNQSSGSSGELAVDAARQPVGQGLVAYLHRDQKITDEQWNALIEGMSPLGAGRVANWLAHGMHCIRKPDGVRLERQDYEKRGKCLFITMDGEQSEIPLMASSSQCLIWHRWRNHTDEVRMGEICPRGDGWQAFYPSAPPAQAGTALTSEEVNSLPEHVRKYIMWLEAETDAAGIVQDNFRLTEENAALRAMIAECTPDQDMDQSPRPMETAPHDGTLIRLLVNYTDNSIEDAVGPSWTIGHNGRDSTGEDEWQFAGWCWTHDHFTQGKGTPVGWLPLVDGSKALNLGELDDLLSAWQTRFDSGVRPHDGEPEDQALWDRIQAARDLIQGGSADSPVDLLPVVQLAYGLLWMTSDDPATSALGTLPPYVSVSRARTTLRDAISHTQRGEGITAARALIDNSKAVQQ